MAERKRISSRPLAWIASAGLFLAVVFFALAIASAPRIFDPMRNFNFKWTDKDGSMQSSVRQWDWDGGDTLQINIPADISIVPEGSPSVILRGEGLDQVNVSHGMVTAHDGSVFGRDHLIEMELHGVTLHQITLSGLGRLKLGHVAQDRLSLAISGTGNISAEDGHVGTLDLTISGAGDAQLRRIAADHVRVNISGAGHADLSPIQDADITISGVGNVRLATKPQNLTTHVSGLGSVSGPGFRDRGKDKDKDDQPPEPPAPLAPH
jgi:Putative auto-transporter adhesin, head GIN domain